VYLLGDLNTPDPFIPDDPFIPELRVETQNINLPAGGFYARQGCRLISINRRGYEAFPNEVQLIWSLEL
jgi:hypothetical protein